MLTICLVILYLIFLHFVDAYDKSRNQSAYPEIVDFLFNNHKPYGMAFCIVFAICSILVSGLAPSEIAMAINISITIITVCIILGIILNKYLHSRRVDEYRKRDYFVKLLPQTIVSENLFLSWVDGEIFDLSEIDFYARPKAPRVCGVKWLWEPIKPTFLIKRNDYIVSRFYIPASTPGLTYEVMPVLKSDKNLKMKDATERYCEGLMDYGLRGYTDLYFIFGYGEGTPSKYSEHEGTVEVSKEDYAKIQSIREAGGDWMSDVSLTRVKKDVWQKVKFIIATECDHDIQDRIESGAYKVTIS